MKRFSTLFFFIHLLLVFTQVFANDVIVKGVITNTNGAPIANQQVRISIDTTVNNCRQVKEVFTNPNGFYTATLSCPGSIVKVIISTKNCDGTYLTERPQVPPGGVVERNFVLCVSPQPPTNCNAVFRFERTNSLAFFTVKFNSEGSSAATLNDAIVKRRWRFGDGTILEGNEAHPTHNYAAKGTYEVCLTIVTAAGCEKTTCQKVIIEGAPTNCEATFKFEKSLNNPLLIHFNSNASHGATATDNIVKRKWRFGDGSVLDGNEINPTHTYATKGTYEVCLTIITAAGCEKTTCHKVVIEGVPTTCQATFKFEKSLNNPFLFHFNSSASHGATATDNIVKRKWRFGDGSVLEGNEINPAHTYATKGIYEVCLTIVTTAGCEKTTCQKIVIEENTYCKPEFTFSPTISNYKEIKFNSAASTTAAGDKIISRRWLFGDGTEATTIDPVHTYARDGIYKVCLVIKTEKGCTKELCREIEIKAAKCEAYFLYSVLPVNANAPYSVKFNSATSASNDSIISRSWTFGDGTTATTVDPTHHYAKPGLYNVCLVIKTRNGCESKICKEVLVGPNAQQCATHFTFERLSHKKIRFNSSMSWAAVGDNIIERKWNFGDGSPVVSGNLVSVLKEFNRPGTYSVCLSTKSAKGCESKICISIKIEDTTSRVETAPIKIVTLYPAPVHTQMTTEVWSLHNNVQATLAVFDIYGVKKWEMQKVLVQGVNVTVVPTTSLLAGPYFFKVTTMYGTQSRQFYKL